MIRLVLLVSLSCAFAKPGFDAYLTGVKGNYGTIGVSAQVKRKHCKAGINAAHHTQSIAQWALNAGKSIGLVTTTRVTHASPAGFYAHTAERDWENNQDVLDDKCDDVEVDDIAEQLVYGPIGQKLKVIFGGGRRNFFDKSEKDEQGNKGKRTDDKNLIEEWLANKRPGEERTYVYDKERGSNIFGVASRGDDDATPYLKLSFANGPGFVAENRKKNNRTDPSTSAKLNNFSYLSPATVPLADETHGGDDVVIFAAGPHSHLFSGSMEQHTIPHFMGYATCIGDGITHCNRDKVQRSSL